LRGFGVVHAGPPQPAGCAWLDPQRRISRSIVSVSQGPVLRFPYAARPMPGASALLRYCQRSSKVISQPTPGYPLGRTVGTVDRARSAYGDCARKLDRQAARS